VSLHHAKNKNLSSLVPKPLLNCNNNNKYAIKKLLSPNNGDSIFDFITSGKDRKNSVREVLPDNVDNTEKSFWNKPHNMMSTAWKPSSSLVKFSDKNGVTLATTHKVMDGSPAIILADWTPNIVAQKEHRSLFEMTTLTSSIESMPIFSNRRPILLGKNSLINRPFIVGLSVVLLAVMYGGGGFASLVSLLLLLAGSYHNWTLLHLIDFKNDFQKKLEDLRNSNTKLMESRDMLVTELEEISLRNSNLEESRAILLTKLEDATKHNVSVEESRAMLLAKLDKCKELLLVSINQRFLLSTFAAAKTLQEIMRDIVRHRQLIEDVKVLQKDLVKE